jgi:RNA polymerase sigma-70 factor (ECF subfamily)
VDDAFTAMYRAHAADVHRFALWLTRDAHAAEDLVSETFVRAWTAAGPIREPTVKGYLFAIARNLHLQRLRRARREIVGLGTTEPHDPAPGPHVAAERASDVATALAHVDALPDSERDALLLRAVHELPYDAIAAALGVSLAAVKVRIHRARRALLARRGGA